jgi:hypothetical protein
VCEHERERNGVNPNVVGRTAYVRRREASRQNAIRKPKSLCGTHGPHRKNHRIGIIDNAVIHFQSPRLPPQQRSACDIVVKVAKLEKRILPDRTAVNNIRSNAPNDRRVGHSPLRARAGRAECTAINPCSTILCDVQTIESAFQGSVQIEETHTSTGVPALIEIRVTEKSV